jgi:hypothetical protein
MAAEIVIQRPQVFQIEITRPGLQGPSNVLTIGTVQSGVVAEATITGTAPAQSLNLVLPRGNNGLAATLAVGAVTTLPPGSPATVQNVGTPNDAVLNIAIPAGNDGADGASTWEDISGKPSTFPPEAHTHLAAAISDFSTAADARISGAIGVSVQAYNAALTSWAGVTRAAGFDAFVQDPTSVNLKALVTSETGSGALVFGTSPSFTTDIRPATDDGASLGISGTAWSDFYLALGGVINWAAGDVTITHSANRLDFAGASTGYTFDSVVTIGSSTLIAGRTFTLDGATAANGQPAFAFNASGHVATNRIMGIIYDGAQFLAKAGLVFQELSDTGAYVNNGATMWRDGSLTLGNGTSVTAGPGCLRLVGGSIQRTAPVTKTGDFTVAAGDNWIIVNKGSACVVTLPSAANFPNREIMMKVITAHAVTSASSNVVPLAGGAAGTAMLSGTAGRWCTLVSDGTNWIIMQGVT